MNIQRSTVIMLLYFILVSGYLPPAAAVSGEKWAGVDESVVEKFAEEHGRGAKDPVVDTDRGDLLLFLFLVAGAAGGFAAGYYWRTLTEQKNKKGNQAEEFKTVQ